MPKIGSCGELEKLPPRRKVWIGLDPGASGGLAVLVEGDADARAEAMPATDQDIWRWIDRWSNISWGVRSFAVLEKVGGFIKGNPAPGSAMFRFGASYGALRMALTAAGIPFEEITPQRWQKALGIPIKRKHTHMIPYVVTKGKNKGKTVQKRAGGETDAEFKGRLRQRAQQLFPQLKVTLATADSLLIAEFCRRKCEGRL